MKKFMRLFLVFIFALAIIPDNTSAEDVQKESLVIAVDKSFSTNSKDLELLKKRLKNFTKYYLEGDSNREVTLVAYKEKAELLALRETEPEVLYREIDKIKPIGLSDISKLYDLIRANDLDGSNLLLFSNSYPNLSRLEKQGPFTIKDHLYFRNANYAYKSSEGLSLNTFTISDLNKGTPTDKKFIKKLNGLISDEVLYIGEDTDLDGAFERASEYFGLNNYEAFVEDDSPIIFVPGISGTNLYQLNENASLSEEELAIGSIIGERPRNARMVWLPILYDKNLINEHLGIANPIYPLQQGDLSKIEPIKRMMGPAGLYTALLNRLIWEFPNKEIYLFGYDWRQSNEVTSEKLNNFVDMITEDKENKKVDLVVHSMGGLIGSHFITDHGEKVGKYLSFGAPYEGAPHSYNEMASGNIMGGISDFYLNDIQGISLNIMRDYPGVVELMQTERMLDKYPVQMIEDKDKYQDFLENRENYIAGLKIGKLNYENSIKALHENGISRNFTNDEFKESLVSLVGIDMYDDFQRVSNSYREENNPQNLINTLFYEDAMFFYSTGVITEVSSFFTKEEDEYKVEDIAYTVKGDSMVPEISATFGEELENFSPKIQEKFRLVHGDHMMMLVDPRNLDGMVDYLNGKEPGIIRRDLRKDYKIVKIETEGEVEVLSGGEILSEDSSADFGNIVDLEGKKIISLEGDKEYELRISGDEAATTIVESYSKDDEFLGEEKLENEDTILIK